MLFNKINLNPLKNRHVQVRIVNDENSPVEDLDEAADKTSSPIDTKGFWVTPADALAAVAVLTLVNGFVAVTIIKAVK